MTSLLRSAGMTGMAFSGAEELLACGTQATLACILTDLHMPDMTGLELQAEMTRRGWRNPLIVMTAYPTNTARSQALGAGAIAFLTKPLNPDALLEAIEDAIASSARA